MKYIQYRCPYTNTLETIDQAQTYKEAMYLLNEYRLAFNVGHLYISQRPWN